MANRLLLFFNLLLVVLCNKKPVFGILGNPYPVDTGDLIENRINFDYVRWLENAGAISVAIHPWYSEKELDELFVKINGVIFLGGDRLLTLSKKYEQVAKYLVDKVIEYSEKGVRIPLWGTCQGFQLIHSIFMKKVDLRNFNSWEYPSPIIINKKDAKMFSLYNDIDIIESEKGNNYVEYHRLGIQEEQYKEYPTLNEVFEINSFALDRDGKKYIASVEGKKYPIYAVQFHPEMINTINERYVPFGLVPIRLSENLGNFLVDEARKNDNKFNSEDYKKYDFIEIHKKLPVKGEEAYVYEFKNQTPNFLI
jgi:gamma-glutamyl hydrolase